MPKLAERLSDLLVFALALPIRAYRLIFSPLLPPACRFHPSCSRYALGALYAHGPFRGTYLLLRRIARCQPFHPGGLDPVPPPEGRRAERLGILPPSSSPR